MIVKVHHLSELLQVEQMVQHHRVEDEAQHGVEDEAWQGAKDEAMHGIEDAVHQCM